MPSLRPALGSGRTIILVVGAPVIINPTNPQIRSGIFVMQIPPSAAGRMVALTWAVTPAVATGLIGEVGGSATAFGHVDGETVTISDGPLADGFSGGIVFEYDQDGIVVPGQIPIVITPLMTAENVAIQTMNAINASVLDITASIDTPVDPTEVILTGNRGGTYTNIAIMDSVASAGYTVSGMSLATDIAPPVLTSPGSPRETGAGVWENDWFGNQIQLEIVDDGSGTGITVETFFATDVRTQREVGLTSQG